jgi:hypothetical protein
MPLPNRQQLRGWRLSARILRILVANDRGDLVGEISSIVTSLGYKVVALSGEYVDDPPPREPREER